MGRRIKTVWFGQYRAAAAELPTAIASGERRAEVLLRHARLAGVKESGFARMMKAGRTLDSLAPQLQIEQVHCTYTQADLLGRIAQISLTHAQALLPEVLNNQCSLEQLKTALAKLQQAQPDTASLHNRDSTRRLILAHERSCAEAIARVGGEFFGVAGGRVLRQTSSRLYQAPNFIVVQGEAIQAAIFIRVGAISKSPTAVSLDLLQLALAHHTRVPHIWFLLPQDSPVVASLSELSTYIGGGGQKAEWLNIATLNADTGDLKELSDDAYLTRAMLFVMEHTANELRWEGRDITTGEEASLEYF